MSHNETMNIADWIASLPGAPNPTEAAQKAHVSKATLFRHLERGETTAENVIALARAYGVRPVDALVELGYLTAEEATSERLAIREALKGATIQEKWDSIADDMDNARLIIGSFPRFSDLDARALGSIGGENRRQRRGHVDEPDYDSIISGINAGTEQIAAQEATDPLDEHFT